MTKEETIEYLEYLRKQIPNPYDKDIWYTVKDKNNQELEMRLTKIGFCHFRKMTKKVLKSPDGEILSRWDEYNYFRANFKTGKIELI